MEQRTFGRTGRRVTAIGLGAWPIGQKERADAPPTGSYGHVPEDLGRRTVERYVELGGTFIDTARAYGTSEAVIGSCPFMKHSRDTVFVATKTRNTDSPDAVDRIPSDLEESLRNLNTDYVDLFQIHAPPEDPDLMKRVIEVFARLRDSGRVRAVGASVKGPDVTPATVELAKRYVDTGQIDALQLIYSIFRRRHEETIAYAAERGVAIIARTVLESGFLTGKYEPDAAFAGHRARWGDERRRTLLEYASELAAKVEPPYESLAQVAQKFALSQPGVSVIIPGAKNPQQVEANCAVDGLPALSERMRTSIDSLPAEIGDLANTGE
jgi:aryl-alcohol dehydrogenase-like predicted oxidoreductase